MKEIIEQKHKIKVFGKNMNHYKNLGFNCCFGDIIEVLSGQLPLNSRIKIKAICAMCNKENETDMATITRCKNGYVCSHKCRAAKTKRNLLDKFGLENPSQLPKSKKKRIETNLAKYGVENISQNECIKDKKVKTFKEKYGVNNISQLEEIKESKRATTLKNYGVEYPSQCKSVRKKYEKSIEKRYGEGIINCSQSAEVMDKKLRTGIKTRKYKLPSGKIVKIQGYENFAIEHLLKTFNEESLLIGAIEIEKHIGRITYLDKSGDEKRYFPDIYEITTNTIYEIKSTYTITLEPDKIERKRLATIQKGFNFKFLVFDSKGRLMNQYSTVKVKIF